MAPITTTIRSIPTEVPLTKVDGMPRDCAINLDHIQMVGCARIGPLITKLGAEKMVLLPSALHSALGFREA